MSAPTDWSTTEPKTEVIVTGQPGVWWFHCLNETDGSITVWGGSKNPMRQRSYRTFTADRCRTIVRRKVVVR